MRICLDLQFGTVLYGTVRCRKSTVEVRYGTVVGTLKHITKDRTY